MNTQNLKLDDVPAAFAAIPATGVNTTFSGKAKVNADLHSHVQGLAPYRNVHILTHSVFNEPSGRLLVVDRRPNHTTLLDAITLPPLSQTKPFFYHPGGCQIIGDCLVLPVETGNGHSFVCFLDVSDPNNIVEVNPALRIRRDFHDAGAVGVTNFSVSGKEFWLVSAYDNGATDVYVSDTETFPGSFHLAFSLTLEETEYQSLSLVTDVANNVFAIGLHRRSDGKDMAALLSLDLQKKNATLVAERHFRTRGRDDIIGGGPHFRWGAGIEIVSTSELSIFCSARRYDNGCQINAFVSKPQPAAAPRARAAARGAGRPRARRSPSPTLRVTRTRRPRRRR